MITDLTKPVSARFACPACGKLNEGQNLFFQGIHVLADSKCPDCHLDYYHTLPLAFTADNPVSFSRDGKVTEFPVKSEWLATPLIRSMTSGRKIIAEIEPEVYRSPGKHAILINCLDDCFGYVFTKLCNVTMCKKKHADAHVIALLPEKLKWLIPEQLDEAWLVKGALRDMHGRIDGLDAFIQEQVAAYETFQLYEAEIFIDSNEVDFKDYLHVAPFDYSNSGSMDKQVTFILREDRFWHSGKSEEFFLRLFTRLGMGDSMRKLLCKRQNKRVMKTVKRLLKEDPEIRVAVAGIGATGKFASPIEDRRLTRMSDEDERSWLDLYARSHVVIGIHGSNMILPGIQAGTMIELVPDHRHQRIGETILKDYPAKNMCEHILGYCTPVRLSGIIGKKLEFLEKSRLV